MNKKNTLIFCMISFLSNMVLFVAKLYVGLASNSISIYSDGINNLFDSLSGIISFACLTVIMKSVGVSGQGIVKKSEQLLSFLMAIIVGITGFYFAYSSLERLMYPTPITFYTRYLAVLIVTALVKLALFVAFRLARKKTASPIVRVMAFDSLLDFFVTSVTVLTLIVSAYGSYSVDAICGIVISCVVIVSAVKMIFEQVKKLIGYVPTDVRAEAEERILENGNVENIESINFVYEEDIPTAYTKLQLRSESDYISVKTEVEKKFEGTQITVKVI